MDIKEWLSRGRELNKRIDALEKSKAMAFDAATSVTASSGGGGGSEVSRKAESYSALSEELDRELKRLDGILAEITALISNVEDNTLATLLQDRYVRCMTWDQIADELGYCRFHVTKTLHPAALEEAEKEFLFVYTPPVV